jgi:hypothetical protein
VIAPGESSRAPRLARRPIGRSRCRQCNRAPPASMRVKAIVPVAFAQPILRFGRAARPAFHGNASIASPGLSWQCRHCEPGQQPALVDLVRRRRRLAVDSVINTLLGPISIEIPESGGPEPFPATACGIRRDGAASERSQTPRRRPLSSIDRKQPSSRPGRGSSQHRACGSTANARIRLRGSCARRRTQRPISIGRRTCRRSNSISHGDNGTVKAFTGRLPGRLNHVRHLNAEPRDLPFRHRGLACECR